MKAPKDISFGWMQGVASENTTKVGKNNKYSKKRNADVQVSYSDPERKN